MNKPHKHVDLIKAWADGATIQHYSTLYDKWYDIEHYEPDWKNNIQYRVKPPREFPKSSIRFDTLCKLKNEANEIVYHGLPNGSLVDIFGHLVADEAVKQYILDCEQNNET